MKARIVKAIIRWLWLNYGDIFKEILKGEKRHVHRNNKRKKQKGEGEA